MISKALFSPLRLIRLAVLDALSVVRSKSWPMPLTEDAMSRNSAEKMLRLST